MTKRIQDYLSYPTGSFQHAQVFVTSLFCGLMARGPATSGLNFWATALHARPLAMSAIVIGGAAPAPGTAEASINDLNDFIVGLVNAGSSAEMAYINSSDPSVRAVAGGHFVRRVDGTTGSGSVDHGRFTMPTNAGTNIATRTAEAIRAALLWPDHNQQHVNHISFALLKHEAGSNSTQAQQSSITGDAASLAYAIANYL